MLPLRNLSRGGLCFLNNLPLKPGRRLSLQLHYSNDTPPLTLHGEVAYFYPMPRHFAGYSFRIGVEFMPFTGKRACNVPSALEVILRLEQQYL
jgi:hypothetical protein